MQVIACRRTRRCILRCGNTGNNIQTFCQRSSLYRREAGIHSSGQEGYIIIVGAGCRAGLRDRVGICVCAKGFVPVPFVAVIRRRAGGIQNTVCALLRGSQTVAGCRLHHENDLITGGNIDLGGRSCGIHRCDDFAVFEQGSLALAAADIHRSRRRNDRSGCIACVGRRLDVETKGLICNIGGCGGGVAAPVRGACCIHTKVTAGCDMLQIAAVRINLENLILICSDLYAGV